MRDQFKPQGKPEAVPEGHTPVDSSALKSYKYDPAKKEFHAVTKTGATYIHGEVTPEEAVAFDKAESKGKAWNEIRDNHRMVAKVPYGQRISSTPINFRGVTPESAAPTKTSLGDVMPNRGAQLAKAGDLTADLEKSLANVKRTRVDRAPVKSTLAKGIPNALEPAEEVRADLRRTGESQAVPEPNRPSTQPAPGAATKIRIPGEDKNYPATYQVRELEDVHPSHSGINFQANPKYALTNDRDYANPLNQGKVAMNSTPGKFDPSYHITDNPDATNGPVVIDSNGHALGGNGRAMILQRVYAQNPEGAAAYKDALTKKAAQFGLDANAIGKMKQPVLVREIANQDLGGTAAKQATGKQEAITDFNKSGTAAMTPAERAVTDSRRVSQGTLDHIAGRVESEGADGTLGDVLRGRSGGEILDRLIQDGVLTHQDRAAFADENGLTEAGRDRISKLIVGRFFRDPAQLDSTPPAIRNKVESMAAPLARVDGVEGWDLTPKIHEALDLLEEARTHGTQNLDDILQQQGLFGDSAKYSPEGIALAKKMQSMPARTLTKAMRQYAQDAADSQRPLLLGQSVTSEQAFNDAFSAR
jgi:hypothetical protein